MKNILVVVLSLFASLLISCSHSGDNVAPASQKSLGLVVPGAASNLTSKLILLKDGRTANPVSGITGFDTIPVGNKLSLAFTAGATHNGILDIHVTHFSSAQDSVFIPAPPIENIDSTAFTGIFSGVAYIVSADSSLIHTDTTSITFTQPNKYVCSGAPNYPAAGSGTFVVYNGMITFIDASPKSNSLTGSFTFSLSTGNLYMWREENGTHYGLSLRQK